MKMEVDDRNEQTPNDSKCRGILIIKGFDCVSIDDMGSLSCLKSFVLSGISIPPFYFCERD